LDRTRSAELAALTAIAAQVNCTTDLDELLRGALQTTLDVVGVDAGEVFLVDEETGALVLHAHVGLSEVFLADESLIGPGDCLCGVAARSKQIVAATDLASHPARSRPACLREGFHSLLCLPLRAHQQVLGLLNVQSRSARQFTDADQELLVAIGNQIGIAIANARLIEAAEQRRATLDSVMTSLVDGLILVDRRGKIAFANPRAEEMLRLPPQSLSGQNVNTVDQWIARYVDGPQTDPLQAAAAVPQPGAGVEFTLALPVQRTLQARGFPIHNEGGEDLGQGLLLRDVSREKELDNMKSQLLATVSHELRTPLASIKGFATTLLREDVEWDDASRREFLAIIDQESDRLSELISNLLDMSRIEAGTLRVVPEPTELHRLVEETAGEFVAMAQDHPIRVTTAPTLPGVWADPRRIRQVLRNLIENAIKYSPEASPISISARAAADHVQISVADQGAGIAAEHLDHVFERFYQVDSASTRQVGGAGLGLSICKAIVEAHHGRIWVESQAGSGSVFHFTLPQSSPEAP
jgi:signal transduction histidine kinase